MYKVTIPHNIDNATQLALLYDLLYPSTPLNIASKLLFIQDVLDQENYVLTFATEKEAETAEKILTIEKAPCGCNK